MSEFRRGFEFTLGALAAIFVFIGGGTIGYWLSAAIS